MVSWLSCLTVCVAAGAMPAASPVTVHGRVLSEAEEPLAGAVVEAGSGTTAATQITDETGGFELTLALPAVLHVSHFSHVPRVVELSAADPESPLLIRLSRRPPFQDRLLVQGAGSGDRYSPGLIASTAIDPAELVVAPASVSAAVVRTAGVAENGQGGLFQVVSIRGVSRQRVQSLISGARLTAERRAGVSTSFLDPLLIGEIDVLRGPASTYYGSGALGGALQIEPRRFEAWRASTGYETQGDQRHLALGWGRKELSLGIVHRRAGRSETPSGDEMHDGFEQLSATLRPRFGSDRRSFDLLVIGSYGDDIGKPSADFPERATTYPRERHLMLRLATATARSRAHAFVHPHDLLTEVEQTDSRQLVDHQTFDFGALWERRFAVGAGELRLGGDYFGRRGVDVRELDEQLATGTTELSRSLDGAEEDEAAGFAVFERSHRRLQLELGARATWIRQRNGELPSRSSSHLTGFAGATVDLPGRLEALVHLGRGLRVPSLSERFFRGTTSRGTTLGNPELSSESAQNAELGLRYLGDRTLVRAALFRNRIDDYVERVEIAPGVLTFLNLLSGTVDGAELEAVAQLDPAWKLVVGGHRIRSEDSSGAPLADAPSDRLRLGARYRQLRWQSGLDLSFRRRRTEVGSGEQAIPEAFLIDATVAYRLPRGLDVAVAASNLGDELTFPSADRQASPAAGRSFAITVSWQGKSGAQMRP